MDMNEFQRSAEEDLAKSLERFEEAITTNCRRRFFQMYFCLAFSTLFLLFLSIAFKYFWEIPALSKIFLWIGFSEFVLSMLFLVIGGFLLPRRPKKTIQ